MVYTKDKLEKLRHRWTTPHGHKILKQIKKSKCYLSPALFHEEVSNFPGINDPELEGKVDLRGAPLSGFDFRTTVNEDNNFNEEMAVLSDIHFEGAFLKYCNFENGKIHDCFFEDADLYHANFQNSYLTNCHFQNSTLVTTNFHGSRFANCKFQDALIKDFNVEGAIIDQKSNFGRTLRSEKEGHYHFASIEYKQIKQIYKNSSLHELADKFHYKEMIAKRLLHSKNSPFYWVNYIFGDLLCKYGTSFSRVLICSFVLIIGCGFIYNSENALALHGQALSHPGLPAAMYFSVVTFTTLGYGDYNAIGNMRFIAAGEAFLGAILIALFTVIVARKIIRD
jgi:hypothetical protein